MTAQITLTLSEKLLERAERWAQRMGRPVPEVLTQLIESSLAPLGSEAELPRPINDWTDGEVLAAADEQMSAEDDNRISELLHRQQEGLLTSPERAELSARMLAYQEGLLRKAQGLSEAVRRGLRMPVQP